MCVGGLGSELAEWVPHVRALCFDGSDTFEGDKCFFLSPRYFIASLNASLCANLIIRLTKLYLPLICPEIRDIFHCYC